MKLHTSCLFIILLALHGIRKDAVASSDLSNDPFRGISAEDEKYYKSDVIKCKDGSGKFTRAQLNDDYCDCIDGTDEPGTSACPGGKFYCKNTGHTPLLLFSSRVNDGICDCCDGSDEYGTVIKCPNTCWEAGKVARDKLKKRITTYQEGVTIRKHEVEEAKLAIAKDEEELSRLKKEEKVLKDIVGQLKERKEEIEKAEEKERLQKEKEEKARKEAEEKANGDNAKSEGEVEPEQKETPDETKDEDIESMDHEKIGELEETPLDESEVKEHDDVPNVAEELFDNVAEQTDKPIPFTQKKEAATASETAHEAGREVPSGEIKIEGNGVSENTEGLSKEELGRLIASRWTGEKAEEEIKEVTTESYDQKIHKDTPNDAHDEEDDGDVSETDDDIDDKKYEYDDPDDEPLSDIPEEEYHDHSSLEHESNDDLDLSDISTDSNPSWLEKIQKTVRNLLKAVNLIKTPVDKSEADQVRKEYESANSKLSKIHSRISKLSEKLKLDFGPEKEFYSFYGRCFDSKQNKYTYKVCPFKDATQEEGYSKTRLGSWLKFDDSNRVMIFANGDKCWNGPDRSLKVKLRCGLTNEFTDVDEPSRCEYVALLFTPALCLEDKLKELEQKLELMNKQPERHDEL